MTRLSYLRINNSAKLPAALNSIYSSLARKLTFDKLPSSKLAPSWGYARDSSTIAPLASVVSMASSYHL
jgi:hypothetical protein